MTSAALILFLAFVAMASGPGTDLKMMATGLAAGILLDATIIRALIVPAVISLMGRWNWWLPTLAGARAAGRAVGAGQARGARERGVAEGEPESLTAAYPARPPGNGLVSAISWIATSG